MAPKIQIPHRFFRHRLLAIAAAVTMLAALGGGAAAVTVGNGSLGGFENDGNLVVDGGGSAKDWANVSPVVAMDDTDDSGFQGSSKEEDPGSWTCNNGGANPGKGDILRAYVSPRINTDEAWLDLAFVRADGTGDAHINFEFNRNAPPTGTDCEIDRQVNDFLVTYDFSGGSDPADIRTWRWDGSHWVELTITAADAKAATNAATVADPVAGGSIEPRRFGETTLNLLAPALPQGLVGCPGFGYVNVRSRSSHSITSALQDRVPTTVVDLNTCGKIIVHKADDHVPPQPLAGATFGLFDNAGAAGSPLQTAASAANGNVTFNNVAPGNYWVTELTAPANYTKDPDIVGPITVSFRDVIDVAEAFVDPRDVGSVRIVKKLADEHGDPITPDQSSDLDGASFLVFKDGNGNGTYQAGEEAKLWPNETENAECTISGGAGYCDVGPLATGTYGVHETAAPDGSSPSGDVHPVIVTKNTTVTVDYVNSLSPLNITLQKAGPDEAHVGDTIHYTFAVTTMGPRLHDVAVTELTDDRCDGAIAGPAKTGGDGDGSLELGETWTYDCDHIVTASDPDPLPNEAKVTGTDDFGRTVTDTDSHVVDILKPAITLDKKVGGGDHKPIGNALQTHEGDALDYTISIANSGDAPLTITTLADSLKAAVPAFCTSGIGASLAVGGAITCTYTSTATDDAHNIASVTGIDALGGTAGTVSSSDETFVDVVHPAIEIAKTGTTTAHEGDGIGYSFEITNTGDVELTGVSVDDDKLGHIGDISTLAVGATQTLVRNAVAPADDVHNVAEACGDDPLGLEVCDSDDHDLNVINPAIQITKTGTAQAYEGDTTSYSFEVENTGDVPLTDVSVDDDVLGHIGDIGSLAVGEKQTLTATSTAPSDDLRNVATACGDDELGKEVCDDDDHIVDIVHPGIDITKSGAILAHEGDEVTYTFDVTNTGDVALAPVIVTDDILGEVGTITALASGASTTLTKSYTVPASTNEVENVAEACGIGPVGVSEFCDTDLHHLTVIHPALIVDKKVNGNDHKPAGDALLAHEGDVLNYTVVVTNSGDTDLEITALDDTLQADLPSSCSKAIGDTLVAGASMTCAYSSEAPGDDAHNVVSVTGADILGGSKGTVSGDDETFVDVIHPAIEVVKDGVAMAHEGDAITYTFKVTNTGDVPLAEVTVSDDILGDIGVVDSLAVGASTTLTKDFEVPAGSDTVTNVAEACGVDPIDLALCDDDTHTTAVIHPSIELVKTADPEAGGPRDVTYTYVVTNTGDAALTRVVVTDDILGEIGTIDELGPGESATLTRTVAVDGGSPTLNIGVACGDDPLGVEFCATDDAEIAIVLAVDVVAPVLPRTGLGVRLWLLMAGLALAAGAAALNWESTTTTAGPRRRRRRGPAT